MSGNRKTSKRSQGEDKVEKVTEMDLVEEFVPDNEAIIQNRNISCILMKYNVISRRF